MGAYTEWKIKSWQKQAGIEPATGAEAELLRQISETAFELIKDFHDDCRIPSAAYELIKVIELERSGIRDGDGYWHGGDVIGHVRGDMVEICKAHVESYAYPSNTEAHLKAMVELCTKWIDHERTEWVASRWPVKATSDAISF
jgi:hypothetical protein